MKKFKFLFRQKMKSWIKGKFKFLFKQELQHLEFLENYRKNLMIVTVPDSKFTYSGFLARDRRDAELLKAQLEKFSAYPDAVTIHTNQGFNIDGRN